MEDKYENRITYLLICLIIIGAIVFLMFALDIKVGKKVGKEDILAPKNVENKVEENVVRTIKYMNEVFPDEEYRVDEIESQAEPNRNYVIKYNDNGIIKTQFSYKDMRNGYYTKLIYNYNFSPDLIEITYPVDWISSSYHLEANLDFVYSHKNGESIFGEGAVGAVINELDISEYGNVNNENALEILEIKLNDYLNGKSEIYSFENMERQEVASDDHVYKILKYEYNQGKYYKTYCYSTILVRNENAYVLTFTIPSKQYSDEALDMKEQIIKTFKFNN